MILANHKDVKGAARELDNALQQLGLALDDVPERSLLSRSQGPYAYCAIKPFA